MESCLNTIKQVLNTINFTRNVPICENGCFAFSDPAIETCPECLTKRNKKKGAVLKTVSILDKIAQLLACDHTREMIKEYRSNFKHDGKYQQPQINCKRNRVR
jgi:predicted amidophosphoribosyltransferase